MAIYKIHEDNVKRLGQKLRAINKKCKKYNNPFLVKEVGEEFIEFGYARLIDKRIEKYNETYEEAKRRVEIYPDVKQQHIPLHDIRRFVLFEVEGTAKIDGWEFIATLRHEDAGNVICMAGIEIDIPEIYKTRRHCDHCNSNRARKDTLLIRNVETGEFKQIGRQCIRDYIGIDAEEYAKYLEIFDKLLEFDGNYSHTSERYYVKVIDVIVAAIQISRKLGYCSKQTAVLQDKRPTSAIIYSFFSTHCDEEDRKLQEFVGYDLSNKEDIDKAKELIEWAKTLEGSTYYHNLRTLCSSEYIDPTSLPIVCSIVAAKHNSEQAEARETEAERIRKHSQYVGNEGDKITIKGTICLVSSFEIMYGISYLYRIISDNNVFTWFASKPVADVTKEPINATITGTIKEHSMYRGEKQTKLTRCSVEVNTEEDAVEATDATALEEYFKNESK